MKVYRISQDESGTIVLPAGTKLYHGTIEKFDKSSVRPGDYDGVFWTTDEPMISKTYIPISGGYTILSTRGIIRPSISSSVILVQKLIGVKFDVDSFKMQGPMVTSYIVPDIYMEERFDERFDDMPSYRNTDWKKVAMWANEQLLGLGYQPIDSINDSRPEDAQWKFYINDGKILAPNERSSGRLFTVVLNRDFKIWDKTGGGRIDGDLMEVDYHKVDLFRKIESAGYDGIQINDFAQSHDLGNFGHISIGLFKSSLSDVSISSEPAQHEDLDPWIRKKYEDIVSSR